MNIILLNYNSPGFKTPSSNYVFDRSRQDYCECKIQCGKGIQIQ